MAERNEFIIKSFVLGLLVINAWQDWKKQEISGKSLWVFGIGGLLLAGIRTLYIVCGLDLAGSFFESVSTWRELLAGSAIGGLLMIAAVCSGGAVGLGDGWLLCVTGIFLGLEENLLLLLGGLFLSFIFSAALLLTGKGSRKTKLPFVPFLLAAYAGELIVGKWL